MRRVFLIALFCLMLLSLLAAGAPRAAAQVGDPWGLIAEVNALRASYGLAAYEVNSALMSAAQLQSNHQAEIGSWSHSGPGGSRPHDRAVAAGYGGGAAVGVSENVAMGVNVSPRKVVYEMWQDSIHLETMISTRYRHIGAGVATSGSYVYYTIVVGYIAGSPGSGSSPPASRSTPAPPGQPAPTLLPVRPVQVATPRADGSIIHVVGDGQAPWSIANAYQIPLTNVLALNRLNENSVIFPGDKLLVQVAHTPVVSQSVDELKTGEPEPGAEPTPSPTASPTPRRPARTPTPLALLVTPEIAAPGVASAENLGALVVQPGDQARSGPDYLLIAITVLGFAGTALIVLGNALKRAP